jgi:alpha-L-arabinofuranosidase
MKRTGVTKVVGAILMILIVVCLAAAIYLKLHKNYGEENMNVFDSGKVDEVTVDNEVTKETGSNTEKVTNRYTLTINSSNKGVDIGSMMYGLFFEDINFAADGGIYAELIKNRSFEYTEVLANKGALHGYRNIGESILEIQNTSPLNKNNPNYLKITNSSNEEAGIMNSGFLEGISYTGKEEYRFSVYLRTNDYKGNIKVNLLDKTKKVIGSGEINNIMNEWGKYTINIVAENDATNGSLSLVLDNNGSVDVDMVSLFPVNTYKNRENGLRPDLVKMLEELNPSFIRFPGGCIVEGDPLTSAYRWKDTIGDVAERKQNTNLWIGTKEHPYYQSYGLGFYEYFLLCEDLGAEPVPVVNAGLSCQARSGSKLGVAASDEELQEYIQDALDLIEFCNGDVSTTWGSVRVSMGHPEPFNLEYLGVGNENWESIYFIRYTKFVTAIREVYPEIKLITSSGPASDGGLFNFAWNTMSFHKNDEYKYADLMDEHYYNSADWFLSNTKRYDSYERNYVDVFLGEYAAKSTSLYAAVAEAAFMTGLERNADVVKMASYAPLFGNLLSRQWNPDMIYFNNSTAFGSINYYVQKMFANNVGDYTIESELDGTKGTLSSISGKIGLGTWLTSALFDDVKVVDNETGNVLYESNFKNLDDWKTVSKGNWGLHDDSGNSVYGQTNATYPADGAIMGSATYSGDVNWTNYTYTLKAKKVAGAEGFLIPFGVKDGENFYHWNIGGWGNTMSCVEQAIGGSKSVVSDSKNIPVKTDEWYDIKIEVKADMINCYLNNSLVHSIEVEQSYPIYETVSIDEETGEMIIKVVNSGEASDVIINTQNATNVGSTGILELIAGDKSSMENTVVKPENVVPVTSIIEVSENFTYKAPSYSVSIIRIPVGK